MHQQRRSIALIPARSGSKRVAHKNIRALGGHPLMAYTIWAAQKSGVFDAVVVSTDNEEYATVARHYGADIPFMRPAEFATSTSPDIEWIDYTLRELQNGGADYDIFSILRPTSPFRKPESIARAYEAFVSDGTADSLRAVEKTRLHPGKMWQIEGARMTPLMPYKIGDVPWHSCQMAALPEIYVQNASLEIAWTTTVLEKKSIAGDVVMPWVSAGLEGFDINDAEDWVLAEHYLNSTQLSVPDFGVPAFAGG